MYSRSRRLRASSSCIHAHWRMLIDTAVSDLHLIVIHPGIDDSSWRKVGSQVLNLADRGWTLTVRSRLLPRDSEIDACPCRMWIHRRSDRTRYQRGGLTSPPKKHDVADDVPNASSLCSPQRTRIALLYALVRRSWSC